MDRDQRRLRDAAACACASIVWTRASARRGPRPARSLQVQVERRVDVDGAGVIASGDGSWSSWLAKPSTKYGASVRVPRGTKRQRLGARALRIRAATSNRCPPSPRAPHRGAPCNRSGSVEGRVPQRRLVHAGEQHGLAHRQAPTSLPKYSLAASATPRMPNEPLCPSSASFRWCSRTCSFDSGAFRRDRHKPFGSSFSAGLRFLRQERVLDQLLRMRSSRRACPSVRPNTLSDTAATMAIRSMQGSGGSTSPR